MKLPLPIAGLARRAHNAKSPKDRHDYAFSAWEASIRLAVAALPPADTRPMAPRGMGDWTRVLEVGVERLASPSVREMSRLLDEAMGEAPPAVPRAVPSRQLIDRLPRYRNKVMAHASPRLPAYYELAGSVILKALVEVWEVGLFLPSGSRLVAIESVQKSPGGALRARMLDLTGLGSMLDDEAAAVPVSDDIQPNRLYVHHGDRIRCLYPWVLFDGNDARERILFFNGIGRSLEYLDFDTGELLRGRALRQLFPEVETEAESVWGDRPTHDLTPEPPNEKVIGDFEVEEKLGEGGMGTVYLARQRSLGRRVALKVLSPHSAGDDVSVQRFQREISVLGRCDHPNIVKILVSGESQGRHYYAMEYIDGVDLSSLRPHLKPGVRLGQAVKAAGGNGRMLRGTQSSPADQARSGGGLAGTRSEGEETGWQKRLIQVFRDAAEAVAHLHELGIVHRDIKPANLMLTSFDLRVVLMDLGLASVREASRNLTGEVSGLLGTLRYIPPETLAGVMKADGSSDVYALGATFYELFCGRPLFEGQTEAQLANEILTSYPEHAARANPSLRGDLASILMKAIDRDRRKRYSTAAELVRDLDALIADKPVSARSRTMPYVLRLAVRRNRIAFAVIATAVVAAGISAVVAALVGGEQSGPATDALGDEALNNLCSSELKTRGNPEAAENACRKGLETTTDSDLRARMTYKLGLIRELRGERSAARELYLSALKLKPLMSYEAALFRVSGDAAAAEVDGWRKSTVARVDFRNTALKYGMIQPSPERRDYVARAPLGSQVELLGEVRYDLAKLWEPWYQVRVETDGGLVTGWIHGDIVRPVR